MHRPVASSVRPARAGSSPSPEVARAKALYLRTLRTRVRDGSYFTPGRVDAALRRLLQAVKDDLPQEE